MDRKDFIKICCFATVGVSSTAVLSSCGALYYAKSERRGSRLIVSRSEFVEVRGKKRLDRSFVLLAVDGVRDPICVYQLEENRYQASLLKCTHRGCTLNVGGGIYSCPCHGSEFSVSGEVLNGPADRSLKVFQTEVDDENIYVTLS